jgi:acyl CoA:acetate/3-ketoacid CoA transferase beta subunit
LLERCALPLTAVGVVKLVSTNLGLIEITPSGFLLREIAPDYEPEEVQALTGADLAIASDLRTVQTAG